MNVRELVPWSRAGERGLSPLGSEEGPIGSFHREMNRLFDEALRTFDMPRSTGAISRTNWPRLETSENEQEIRLVVDVPGIAEKDLELSITNGVLTVRGERKSEVKEQERGYSERFYGCFERQIELPQGILENQCNATFDNGVLTVHLPKSAEAKSNTKRVPIASKATKH